MAASEEKLASHPRKKTREDEEGQHADRVPRWFTTVMGALTLAMAAVTVAIYVRAQHAWPDLF